MQLRKNSLFKSKRLFIFIAMGFFALLLSNALSSQGRSEKSEQFFDTDGTLFVNHLYFIDPKVDPTHPLVYYYSWNEAPWIKIHGPLYPPETGWNELRMYSEDELGNRSAEQKFGVFLDSRSPNLELRWKTMPKYWYGNLVIKSGNEIILRANDLESGIGSIDVLFDGLKLPLEMNESAEWKIPSNTEGRHTIEAVTYDRVLNSSKKLSLEWIVDFSPPEIKLMVVPEPLVIDSKNICKRDSSIRIVGQDKYTEIKDYLWKEKGAPEWNQGGSVLKLDYLFPLHKEIFLEFSARDFAGNEVPAMEFHCRFDRKNPESKISRENLPN